MNRRLRARLKNPVHRRSRREEAQISKGFGVDQSLLTSAPTISKHALSGLAHLSSLALATEDHVSRCTHHSTIPAFHFRHYSCPTDMLKPPNTNQNKLEQTKTERKN